MALFPSETDARAFANVRAITTWAGLSEAAHTAFQAQVGTLGDPPRNLALLPASIIRQACQAAQIPVVDDQPRNLTPVEVAQIGIAWRVARRLMGVWGEYTDVDPFVVAPAPVAAAAAVAPAVPPVVGKKVALKAVLDQADESEVQIADETRLRQWANNWETFAQGPPLDEEDPTIEQLTALYHRVVVLLGAPYADFAVFTPYNRRVSRANKFTAHIPQSDGSWLSKEIPGPQNFAVWGYCWAVFRCASIQLGILREAALQAYYQNIKALVDEWPDCWSLIYLAEDKGRAEVLTKKRRAFETSIAAGNPPPALWSADAPWSACLLALATDDNYWNRQVRNLAVSWLTRGRHGAPRTREQAITEGTFTGGAPTVVPQGAALTTPVGVPGLPGQGLSKSSRSKRKLRETLTAGSPSQPTGKGGKGGGKVKGKGRGGGKGGKGGKSVVNSVDATGTQLCFSWNFGNGACANIAAGSPCPAGRTHACTTCLSRAHPCKDHA